MGRTNLNVRQQRFVDGVVRGKTQTEAYVDAYGSDPDMARRSASKLMTKNVIAEEVAKKVARVAEKAEFTIAKNLQAIDRISNSAEESLDFSSALRGRELIGKHLRMFGDQQPTANTQVFVIVAPGQAQTAEQWAQTVEATPHLNPPEQPSDDAA
jgi:terminase small subunit-like protein